jgi:hypothetical protein
MSIPSAWLLITGSRTFTGPRHREVLHAALNQAWTEAQHAGHERLTVVHGAAKGADQAAARWALQTPGVLELPFAADWLADCAPGSCKPGHRRLRSDGREYCPAAGVHRNQRMVNHVARFKPTVLVLGFHASATTDSAGTADCLRRAVAAGLPCRVYDPRGLR